MKLCLIYQNHVDFNYQTILCALQNCIADSVYMRVNISEFIYAHAKTFVLNSQ